MKTILPLQNHQQDKAIIYEASYIILGYFI